MGMVGVFQMCRQNSVMEHKERGDSGPNKGTK